MERAPAGYHSTFALGRVGPGGAAGLSAAAGEELPGSRVGATVCRVPTAAVAPIARAGPAVACHENQFVVYNTNQAQIKYVLHLRQP